MRIPGVAAQTGDRVHGVHGCAQAALIRVVLAVGGDAGLEHHRRKALDGHLPAASVWPVRRLVNAKAGDVLDGQGPSTLDDRGVGEPLC